MCTHVGTHVRAQTHTHMLKEKKKQCVTTKCSLLGLSAMWCIFQKVQNMQANVVQPSPLGEGGCAHQTATSVPSFVSSNSQDIKKGHNSSPTPLPKQRHPLKTAK